jgi:strawberry notch-like protein/NTP hydrolase family protein
MKSPLEQAMSALEDEVGDLDKFAAKELGYKSVKDLHDAFMGLQVDSVAAAIHEMQQGKAVVIADQTGIGKGRQAAAIIRWAAKRGDIPVFITKTPSLFTDMYGDLADIGTSDVNPFIVNSDEWITRPDGSRAFVNKPGLHRKAIENIRNTGTLPDGRNAVFLTYSQINVPNTQQQMLASLSSKAVFVLDESHNAGGDSNTGDFLRSILQNAKGVTYLSATYAKRPDNMPLYFKTDMGEAIGDSGTLVQAMKDGGLPLQTVVSNNLVKAGQMFRRERSYDGVKMATKVDTEHRAEHTKIANGATEALRAIVDADKAFHTTYVGEAQKQAQKENKANQITGGGNEAGKSVHHTEFSSVVHNFVRQMLLGIKANTAADDAIASIRRGEKPIIAVDNTMGSFLATYVGDNNLRDGDALENFDYRTVLSRALERSRYLQIKNAQGDVSKKFVPLNELDPETLRAYKDAQKTIDKLKIDLPVSPIDWIRQRIEAEGYSVAEITGRDLSVDYSDQKAPTVSRVPTQEQNDKVETTRRFNDGRLDSLIINVAGSTGISLHASEKFADQKPRHMIVAQAAQDINIFMQMLGRIHRTGQVKLPGYTILNADLPAEKRPSALLSKKMKSLNANTSSNTESATSVKAADMLNQYGDQIVGNYLADNPQLTAMLHVSPVNDDGSPTPDIARKATGRLAILPVKVQEEFYRDVEQQYNDYIAYLDSTNQNELEPKTFDYDARETRSDTLVEATNPNTPFGDSAIYGEYSIKSQGKPLTPDEATEAIKTHLDGKTPAAHANELIDKLEGELTYYKQSLDPESPMVGQAETVARTARAFIRDHQIGSTLRVEINGDVYSAAVANIRSTHKSSGNPFAMSKINVTLATNGSLRTLAVPATQLERIEVAKLYDKPENIFRGRKAETRETAKIITGNLLAAYGELKDTRGTIINFSKADGTTEQGILLPKKFDFSKNTRGDYRLRDAAHALKFLRKSINPRIEDMGIASRDGNVRVVNNAGKLEVVTPKAKARGGKYFLDHGITDLTGDFVSQQNTMRAAIPKGKETKVIEQLMKKSALYASPSMAEEAKGLAPKEAEEQGSEKPATQASVAKPETSSGELKAGDTVVFEKIPPGSYLREGEEYKVEHASKNSVYFVNPKTGSGTSENRKMLTFAKYLISGESGEANISRLGEVARKEFEKEILPGLEKAKLNLSQVFRGLQHLIAPRAGIPIRTLDSAMRLTGQREQRRWILEQTLEKSAKMFDKMGKEAGIAFIDAYKTGEGQPTPELNELSDFMRKTDEATYRTLVETQVANLGAKAKALWKAMPEDAKTAFLHKIADFKGDETLEKGPLKELADALLTYKDDHFRVLWDKVPGKPEVSGARGVRGRRPLEGSKGFLKQATLATMSEGLERGGEPVTYNPVRMFEVAQADAWRYITAQQMWRDAYLDGGRVFVKSGQPKPEGFDFIEDKIGSVRFPAASGEGMVQAGKWALREDWHRLLSNMLSHDYIRESALGDGLMNVKNQLTGYRLSLSPFHAITTTVSSFASHVGYGMEEANYGVRDLSGRYLVEAAKAFITTPFAPVSDYRLGTLATKYATSPEEFLKTMRGQDFIQKYPEAAQLIDDLFAAGAKLSLHEDERLHSIEGVRQAIAEDRYLAALVKSPFALNQLLMRPLFGYYIPRVKVGTWLRDYSLALEDHAADIDNGSMTRGELARKTWDATENIFGQMNWDARWWHRTFKAAIQFAFRAFTWFAGNLRLVKDAGLGQAREGWESAKWWYEKMGGDAVFPEHTSTGPIPRLDPSFGKLVGLVMTYFLTNAAIQYGRTKELPKDVKDLMAARIGGVDAYGHPLRVVPPAIVMKDALSLWAHGGWGYLRAKESDLLSGISDVVANEDFRHAMIHNPHDSWWKQRYDDAAHVLGSPIGISTYAREKKEGETPAKAAFGIAGFSPAPMKLNESPLERHLHEMQQDKGYGPPMSPEQRAKSDMEHAIIGALRSGNRIPLQEALAQKKINEAERRKLEARGKLSPLEDSATHLGVDDVKELLQTKGITEEERRELDHILARKKARARYSWQTPLAVAQ